MKQSFVAAAALLLASCDTAEYPPAGPYGAPEPYPAEPYPAGPPMIPGGPVDACPIASSRDWRATITTGTDGRPTLVLTGTVVAPSGGYRFEFLPNLTELRSYPPQLIARLLVFAPEGSATQALVTHDLRWQWPLAGPPGTVTIRCGERALAQISPSGARAY